MIGDRREPVARYVQFHDEATQQRFIATAQVAYQRLARMNDWPGEFQLRLPRGATDPTENGRRLRWWAASPGRTITLSAGLANAGRAALQMPGQVQALGGCEVGRRLARSMADVVLDLAQDLAPASVPEQQAHPAYRQTLRLAAELEGLHEVLAEVGCLDPAGCVQARQPDQWGRRAEDVEVAEVRAVLVQLAEAAQDRAQE